MIVVDEPSPIHVIHITITSLFTKHKILFNASAVFLVGCFILVAQARAAAVSEEVTQKNNGEKNTVAVICAINNTQAIKDAQKNTQNKLLTSLCGHAGENKNQTDFAASLHEYLNGYPIEQMADEIAALDPTVAAYIIAMAKQESNWGKRVPVLNGEDCFNYWGFRSKRARMGTGGHTCFDSPQDAVETVAARVHELVYDYGRSTPRQMLIWKCGRSCATHDPAGVERWVHVIARYHAAVTKLAKETAA